MNGSTLAYIGDVYFELRIREHLINLGLTKVDDLHKTAINYTSGEAQSYFIAKFMDEGLLTIEEIEIFKKGRNQASSYRKNISMANYQKATGFEAIVGWLYIKKDYVRIDEIMKKVIEWGSFCGK